MDNAYSQSLNKQRKGITKKMYVVIVMLLVTCVLATATSYAWLVISAAPEVKEVNTVVGANGNLEIALNTNDLRKTELNGVESMPAGLNTFYERNPYWGNLLDLSDKRYGIQNVELKPVMLNIVDQEKSILDVNAPIQFAGYSADGRIVGFDTPSGLASYDFDAKRFTGVLDYGIRVTGENFEGDRLQENVPGKAVRNTYAFCMDLLLRTNAEDANLLLQTKAVDRNNFEDGISDEWYDDPAENIKRGFGSIVKIADAKMRSAIRVAFTDTLTGEIYAIAAADSEGNLQIVGDTNLGKIKSLEKNQVTALTVWVYLEGSMVENLHASSLKTRDLEINIQFGTDVELKPSHGTTDETYDKDASDAEDDGTDYGPVAGTFYFDANGAEQEYYVLDESGNRVYEADFEGTVDPNTRTIVIDRLRTVNHDALYIPSTLIDKVSGRKYAVSLKTDAPIQNAPSEVVFVSVAGAKVGLVGTATGDLLGATRGQYQRIDMSGLDTSNITDMSYMFSDCLKLETLSISGFDTSKVENMSYMFNECRWLAVLDVSGFDTSRVKDMSAMFHNCNVLTELDVTGFDTSKVENMSAMFADCNDLWKINFSNFDTSNVTNMSYMFANGFELKELDISSFETSKVTDMRNMFAYCLYLKKLTVGPGWNKENANVDRMYFGTKLEIYP